MTTAEQQAVERIENEVRLLRAAVDDLVATAVAAGLIQREPQKPKPAAQVVKGERDA